MTQSDSLIPPADDCYRCGYNLHTIANEQPCPECGLLAERSRRMTDELHNTRPAWLASLARGVWLLLAAIFMAFAWLANMPGVITRANQDYARAWEAMVPPPAGVQFIIDYSIEIVVFGLYMAGLMFLLGCWQLTAAEGYPPADLSDRTRRNAILSLALMPVVALGVEHYLSRQGRTIANSMATASNTVPSLWEQILPWAPHTMLAIAAGTLPLLIFYHLRSLAKRARSAHLAEHCAIVGTGTTLAVVYFVGVLIVRSHALNSNAYWVDRSRIWTHVILVAAVAGFLFLFWSLYLLIRFAFSFHRAARQLHAQWKQHDRAQATV